MANDLKKRLELLKAKILDFQSGRTLKELGTLPYTREPEVEAKTKEALDQRDQATLAMHFHLDRWAKHENARRHFAALHNTTADQEEKIKHLDASVNHHNAAKAHLRRARKYYDNMDVGVWGDEHPFDLHASDHIRKTRERAERQSFESHESEKKQPAQPEVVENSNQSENDPDLGKSKNVREKKKELFGGWHTAPDSPQRAKQMEHITRYAEKRYNAPIRRAPGKKNKQGKIIDKPDLTTGYIEHIGNPDSLIHELAHLDTAPERVPMKQFQVEMDDLWGKQNVQYGFKQQARLAPEYEATAIEQKIRRGLGLPAHQKTRTIVDPKAKYAADDSKKRVAISWPNQSVKAKDKKGNPAKGHVKLTAGQKVLSEHTKGLLITRGTDAKYTPEEGWNSSSSPDTLINLRAAGYRTNAKILAERRYKLKKNLEKAKKKLEPIVQPKIGTEERREAIQAREQGNPGQFVNPTVVEFVEGPNKGKKAFVHGESSPHSGHWAAAGPGDALQTVNGGKTNFARLGPKHQNDVKRWTVKETRTEKSTAYYMPPKGVAPVVDATKHAHPLSDEKQKELMHGIRLHEMKPIGQGTLTENNGVMGRTKNLKGEHVIVKSPLDEYAGINKRFNASHREHAFHDVMRDTLGLGKYVPTVARFKHGRQHWSAMKWVHNAKPYNPEIPAHEKAMKEFHASGEAHKLGIADWILGNRDRHSGNYLVGDNGKFHMIDHGLTFVYHGDYHTSSFLDEGPGGNDTHPKAQEWLKGLDHKKLYNHLKKLGVPETHARVAARRLEAVKKTPADAMKVVRGIIKP